MAEGHTEGGLGTGFGGRGITEVEEGPAELGLHGGSVGGGAEEGVAGVHGEGGWKVGRPVLIWESMETDRYFGKYGDLIQFVRYFYFYFTEQCSCSQRSTFIFFFCKFLYKYIRIFVIDFLDPMITELLSSLNF